jgi:hypothetical protein
MSSDESGSPSTDLHMVITSLLYQEAVYQMLTEFMYLQNLGDSGVANTNWNLFTFSAFISTFWTHNSSTAHPAKARPFLNLLRQHTPWAVTMSVTPSQSIQHCHPNFPNYRENGMLPYFENFHILHSCFRPTYHANTHQGGLYTITP